MPVRNGAQFIGSAIDSILSQTLSDLELIVVDDASTDNTLQIIQSYADPRLRCLRNLECLGVSASRNRAMVEARAPYVAFLDADDIAYPQRLEKQIAYLEAHSNVALVGAHLDYIDTNGEFLYSEKHGQRPCDPDALRAELLQRACILPSTATGRKQILIDVGGFPKTHYAEDHDLWCRIAVCHDLAIMPDRLVAYRHHPNQATFKKIGAGYRATLECINRAKQAFLAAGIVTPRQCPARLTFWHRLRGAQGSLGATYLQWADLHAWVLRQYGLALSLSAMALLHSPLNMKVWLSTFRNVEYLLLPVSVSRSLRWYGKKLRGRLTRKNAG